MTHVSLEQHATRFRARPAMLVVHLYRILQLDSSGRVILAALVFTRIHRNAAPVLEDMDTEQAVAEASRLLDESDSAAKP